MCLFNLHQNVSVAIFTKLIKVKQIEFVIVCCWRRERIHFHLKLLIDWVRLRNTTIRLMPIRCTKMVQKKSKQTKNRGSCDIYKIYIVITSTPWQINVLKFSPVISWNLTFFQRTKWGKKHKYFVIKSPSQQMKRMNQYAVFCCINILLLPFYICRHEKICLLDFFLLFKVNKAFIRY